jgi:SAM-dependent methyltransferase
LRFLIVQCNSCGLSFTNPRPDVDCIEQFYPDNYRCHQPKDRREPRSEQARWLSEPWGRRRLLDFGCGAGDFLVRMQAIGWNAVGLDASLSAVTCTRERGLVAHAGSLPHPHWTGPSFEAITMWQSVEHVHHPLEVMRAARGLLTPSGVLVVAVPNFDSLSRHWFGAAWHGLDLPRHLTHFTPATLRAMLERAGFAHVEIRQERRSSWIRHSATGGLWRTRLGSGLAGWWGWLVGRSENLVARAAI